MDQRNFSSDYDTLLDLVKARASVRKLKELGILATVPETKAIYDDSFVPVKF
jgi:hypothetical protein